MKVIFTSEPLQEYIYILNKALKMYTKLKLTFQAIPSLQPARTQGEERWIHRERSRKCKVSTVKSMCSQSSRTIDHHAYIVEIFDFRCAVHLGLKMSFQFQHPNPESQSRESSRIGSISVFIRVFPITKTVDRVSLRPNK